jgi:hypothetical protein
VKAQSLDDPYPDVNRLLFEQGRDILDSDLNKADWDIDSIRSQFKATGVSGRFQSLNEIIGGQFFYGVKTGCNEAFVIDRETRAALIAADRAAAEFIKPLFVGKTIRKWIAEKTSEYLIYVPHGVKPPKTILRHLAPFRGQLEERATKQAWYELQQPQAKYAAQFSEGKLIYPIIARDARFCLNRNGSYINNRAFAIPSDDLFLLGVLNSASFWNLIQATCSPLRGGYFELLGNYLAKMPIPIPVQSDRVAIIALVNKCLNVERSDIVLIEQELDRRVAKLYNSISKDRK